MGDPPLRTTEHAPIASSVNGPDFPGHGMGAVQLLTETFDARRAGLIVRRLCSDEFAGRRVGTQGHDAAQAWLAHYMHGFGLNAEVQRFPVGGVLHLLGAPSLQIVAPDGSSIRSLQHRREFAEHPRSAFFGGPATGVARTWRGEPAAGTWAIFDVVPEGMALDRLVSSLVAANATGILTPQVAGTDGYLSKRIVGGPSVGVPLVAVRPDILASLDGAIVRAMVPMKRVPATGANVIGLLPGSDPGLETEPLLVTAHYDGVGDDPGQRLAGAGDNASGVAVVLEVARVICLSDRRPRRPIMFAALDAEELGAVGSASHAGLLSSGGIRPIVLNLDMAGHFTDAVAAELGPGSEQLMWALDLAGQWLDIPLTLSPVASDNRRYSAAGFIAAGLGLGAPSYHTPGDSVEWVEEASLALAGRLLLAATWLVAFQGRSD